MQLDNSTPDVFGRRVTFGQAYRKTSVWGKRLIGTYIRHVSGRRYIVRPTAGSESGDSGNDK